MVIDISFEGIGDAVFQNEKDFCNKFLKIMCKSLSFSDNEESERLSELSKNVNDLEDVSSVITKFIWKCKKEVVLLVDEVDKSSNNQLFLSFIGMLRNKYLAREIGKDYTFKSVILAGVYDVKSLKLKLRPEDERKYNSPWNIAVDFHVDMSFSPKGISTMLEEYCIDNGFTISENSLDEKESSLIDTSINGLCGKVEGESQSCFSMNIEELSEEIYFFTNGYPFLVSRICQIIDERIYKDDKKPWSKDNVQRAVKSINEEVNTLFESIVKNLENNKELYGLTKRILIDGEQIVFNALDPVISIGVTYGIFKKGEYGLEISNKIFEEIIYNYMISKITTTTKNISMYNFKGAFLEPDGGLNIEKVLRRFQQFMKEQYFCSIDGGFHVPNMKVHFEPFFSRNTYYHLFII